MGVPPGSTPHASLPRKGVVVTGFWLRSPKSGQAMFFRLQEAIATEGLKGGRWSDAEVTCWLYVSDRGIKLTVYND